MDDFRFFRALPQLRAVLTTNVFAMIVAIGVMATTLSTPDQGVPLPGQDGSGQDPSSRDHLPAPATSAVSPTMFARRRRRRTAPAEASASYSRFSSELQDEASIDSQQEMCREAAVRNGQAISPAWEFADEAISGTKLDREGLNALKQAAEEGKYNTLYFFSLSRLARESIIGMPILKRLVHILKVRVISVTEGLDSSREGWETLAQILMLQHERYSKELSANTLRGQKANVKNGYSNGDYCFGFKSEPVAGSEQSRRGRHARPRMVIVVDPVTSVWVRRIFEWFVRERRSIRWITRELNHLGAPKDHRATKPNWRHQMVSRLLANRKYVGDWPWGQMRNVRDPETGEILREPRDADEVEQYRRAMPDLRLVDDETFAAAQAILHDNQERHAHGRNDDGEFMAGRDGAGLPLSHLLSRLIVCGHCNRAFNVGGSNGKYLFCPGYRQGLCSCQTTLNRRLAEQLILEQVGRRILAEAPWLQAVLQFTHAAWQRLQRHLPDELRDAEAGLEEVNRKIARLVDLLESQDRADPDVSARLVARRAERLEFERRVAAARATTSQQQIEPTEEWIRHKIAQLDETLRSATPAAAHALRALVGGKIEVREIRREGKQRHFLRGTLRIQTAGIVAALGVPAITDAELSAFWGEEIVIDFVKEDPLADEINEAWRLHQQGLLNVEIGEQLGCSNAKVTKLLRRAAELRGVPCPDGHRPRKDRDRKNRMPPLYVRIAPKVESLVDQGKLLVEIGEQLKVDSTTLTKAYNRYRADRGLPPLDGRTRRKGLDHKNRPQSDEG
jgi:site-specific DNA recombinase